MTSTTRWAGRGFCFALLTAHGVMSQQPVQFKANVQIQNTADGTTSTGVMYFGGVKSRTEVTMDGQKIVILADPAKRSQLTLMMDDKMYMEMPIGQGPVNVPVTGPTDPANPCSGSGATDCEKGPAETINGYETIRWDYTTQEGTRTRAWVSTKLRFAIKTTDDNGAVEFSKFALGAQPASLFDVPKGYTKMDVGAMAGMGAPGAGRAGARGNPMAGMMSNLSPEAAAAVAAAMRGQTSGEAGPTGSVWEKGKGWILSLTIVGTKVTDRGDERGTNRTTYSSRYVASIPLNYGSPAVGVPGAPGPRWTHMAAEGMGSAEALAMPLTLSAETESKTERAWKGACGIDEPPGSSLATMKGAGKQSVGIKKADLELRGQAVFKIAANLKTFDLLAGVGGAPGKEVTQTHTETTGCRDHALHKTDSTETRDIRYDIGSFELHGVALPATVGPITGSKKMPLRLSGEEIDATVTWTLTPIR